MPDDSLNFYKELVAFTDIKNILNEDYYRKIPEDWYIVITDVKGSTKAIEDGLYKDVNVIGVCSIIAVRNSCDGLEVPFIFGGDGATIFIPPHKIENVKKALSVTKQKSIEEFGLDLRVSVIPVSEIYGSKNEIFVAKMKLSSTADIAMAKGNGLALAEALTKKTDKYEISAKFDFPDAHLGLECRWSPIRSNNGEMLTIIIQSVDNNFEIYNFILNEIYRIVPNLGFLDIDRLNIDLPPKHFHKEVKMKNSGLKKYYVYFFGLFWVAVQSLIVKIKKGQLKYLIDLTKNTDYIKFDESLRMVLDVSAEQKEKLLNLFGQLSKQKKIYFGTHSSDSALLTCFVKSNTDHVHFVDGGSGGYALAAKQLKTMKSAITAI